MTVNKNWISIGAITLLALSCNQQREATEKAEQIAANAAAATAPPEVAEVDGSGMIGPVIETMDAGGYTYVHIKTPAGEVWAAGPPTRVKVGQVVEIRNPMPMADFKSGSLDRTFELIYFSAGITAPGQGDVATGATSAQGESAQGERVAKATDGVTIEDVFLKKDALVGKEILLRGKVVKFTPQIMGKNWFHMQDGSGGAGTNDLTITTAKTLTVGDLVLVRGVLLGDQDYGFGYSYKVIIEDADVTVE